MSDKKDLHWQKRQGRIKDENISNKENEVEIMEKTMDKIIAVAKARGFVYQGSEIYGGLANTWDYGNLGVELKNNVKKAWWKKFIQESPYNVGVDCAILMNPQTWVASGHLGGFSDPLMDCKECKERFRADKIIEDFAQEHDIELESSVDGWSQEKMKAFIDDNNIPCPSCGKHNFTDIRQFNLMFKTFQGVTEDAKNTVYLRPETAQGIFVNFKNVASLFSNPPPICNNIILSSCTCTPIPRMCYRVYICFSINIRFSSSYKFRYSIAGKLFIHQSSYYNHICIKYLYKRQQHLRKSNSYLNEELSCS